MSDAGQTESNASTSPDTESRKRLEPLPATTRTSRPGSSGNRHSNVSVDPYRPGMEWGCFKSFLQNYFWKNRLKFRRIMMNFAAILGNWVWLLRRVNY